MSSTWEWERSTTVKYRLTILCARNVAKQDFFRLPDPFARVIVDGSGQCHTTRSLKGTVDPTWNQQFDLFVGLMESVTISVWNQRKVHKGRGAGFLGCIRITPLAIQRLKDQGYQKLDLTAVNPSEHDYVTGQVVVSIATCEKVSNNVADTWGNVSSAVFNTPGLSSEDGCELQPGWEKRKTPNGRIQYVNTVTHDVQWQRPTRSAYDIMGSEPPDFLPSDPLHGQTVMLYNGEDRKSVDTNHSDISSTIGFLHSAPDAHSRKSSSPRDHGRGTLELNIERGKNVSRKENGVICRLNCFTGTWY